MTREVHARVEKKRYICAHHNDEMICGLRTNLG